MTHRNVIANDSRTQGQSGHSEERQDSGPASQHPHAADTPPRLQGPAVQYCRLTDLVLDNTRLTLMVRQLHYLLGLEGGVTHGGYHWIYQSHGGWLDTFGWRSERAVRRVVDAGRKTGVIVVLRRGSQLSNLYRLDYLELHRRFISADTPFPDWFPHLEDVPEPHSIQPDMLIHASADEVVEHAGVSDRFGQSPESEHAGVSDRSGQSLESERVRVSDRIGQSGVTESVRVSDRIGHSFYTKITTETTNIESPPPPAPPQQGLEADTEENLCSLCGLTEPVDVTEIEIVERFRSDELEVLWVTTDVYGDCRCCRSCRQRDALSAEKCAACLVKEHWVDVVHGQLGWKSATAASRKYLKDPSDLLLAIEAAGAGRDGRYLR